MAISKNHLGLIRKLQHAKGRAESGLCVAEGAKLVNELLLLFPSALRLYVLDKCLPQLQFPPGAEPNLTMVTEAEMSRISALKNPPGILATLPIPRFNMESGSSDKILWLDGIRDPGNMGTLIRTAEWFGFGEIWCTSGCADPFAPKVIQSAMGSVFRMPVFQMDDQLIREKCADGTLSIYGASMDGDDCRQLKVQKPFVLLIGNEGKGISPTAGFFISRKIAVPRVGNSDFPESLNAANAAAVLMFRLSG
jgi:TrmH family RNA methyltransferase